MEEMSDSWYCERCKRIIPRAEVHERLVGGYYHTSKHHILHPVHPGTSPTLEEKTEGGSPMMYITHKCIANSETTLAEGELECPHCHKTSDEWIIKRTQNSDNWVKNQTRPCGCSTLWRVHSWNCKEYPGQSVIREDSVANKATDGVEFVENVDQLLTELLIFASSMSPKELKDMSGPSFNALRRVMKVADRVEAASARGRGPVGTREDLVRERREWEESNRPSVLHRGRDANPALRNNDGEKTGFFGMVEGSVEAGDRNSREPNLYTSENAAGDPIVVDRDAEPKQRMHLDQSGIPHGGTEIYRDGPNSIRAYPSSDDNLVVPPRDTDD